MLRNQGPQLAGAHHVEQGAANEHDEAALMDTCGPHVHMQH